jgi:triosephosphate isomerase
MHAYIRGVLADVLGDADAANSVSILYGGSVKPDNAAELLGQPDIDGALIGGAGLEVDSFTAIIEHARALVASPVA